MKHCFMPYNQKPYISYYIKICIMRVLIIYGFIVMQLVRISSDVTYAAYMVTKIITIYILPLDFRVLYQKDNTTVICVLQGQGIIIPEKIYIKLWITFVTNSLRNS